MTHCNTEYWVLTSIAVSANTTGAAYITLVSLSAGNGPRNVRATGWKGMGGYDCGTAHTDQIEVVLREVRD